MNYEIEPYPGLRPFDYRENYFFFGREGKAQEIAKRLQANHFVAVVGSSGSGKSSLVRAGLLPLLYGGMLYESGSKWRIGIMRPEKSPLRNLAQALVYPANFETDENENRLSDETKIGITEATLHRSGVGLLDFIHNSANSFAEDENLLIVVDQFEELFRFKKESSIEDSDEAVAFVKLLIEATHDKKSRIYVVITMRSDFLGDCAEFQDLPEAINEGQYLIPRLTRDQLRTLIESPAMICDAAISPALVNRLLGDVEEDKSESVEIRERKLRDRLPLLQHALMRTWDEWSRRGTPDKPLDVEHYESIGGMAHALSMHADEAFDELPEREKFITEKMFKCLTDTDSEDRETRRPAKIDEICSVVGAGEEEVFHIVENFRREGRTFLMPPPSVPLTRETVVDISHEALLRDWERLKVWVKQEANDAWQYRRIAADVFLLEEYKEAHKENLESEEYKRNYKDFLWRGVELKDAVRWHDEFKPSFIWASRYQFLTTEEKHRLAELRHISPEKAEEEHQAIINHHYQEVMAFLDKSAENEALEQAEKERIQLERINYEREKAEAAEKLAEGLKNLTKSLKRQRIMLVAFSAVLLLLLTTVAVAYFAWQAQTTAEHARQQAENQKQMAQMNENEAIKQKAIALDQKQRADDEKQKADEQKKIAETEKENAEEQKIIADSEKQKADEQAKIAGESAAEANIQKQKAIAASTKLAREKKLIGYNLDGLFAFENYHYDDAAESFNRLIAEYEKEPDGKEKLKNQWWAKYNLAKIYQQQYRFKDTQRAFQDALNTLRAYEIKKSANINLTEFPQNYFLPASYNSPQTVDADVINYKIITLRKFAQFYRICAIQPETCFERYDLDLTISGSNKIDTYKDAISLNSESIVLYEELLKILTSGNAGNKKNDLYKVDVLRESADIYKDLNNFWQAQENYKRALNISETYDFTSLGNISVMKNLLEVTLPQSDLVEGEVLANKIIKKRESLITQKDIVFDENIGNTYAELAEIYRIANLKAKDIYLDKIKAEEDNIYKTPPSNEDGFDTIQFLHGLKNLSIHSDDYINSYTPPNQTEAEIWQRLLADYKRYAHTLEKTEIFSKIAEGIKNFNKDRNGDLQNQFNIAMELAEVYVANKELNKATMVISVIDEYIKMRYQVDNAEFSLLRLETFMTISEFYYKFLNDSCSAAAYSGKWTDLLEKEFPEHLDGKKVSIYVYFYTTAGKYYYLCSSCSGEFENTRRMLTAYSNYLEKIEENFKETTEEAGVKELRIIFDRIELEILIGQTYEDEKKPNEAAQKYEELLIKIENWVKANQKSVQRLANISANSANVNNTITNSNSMAANTNVFTANTNVFTANTNTGYSSVKTDKGFSFYESYLHVRLAELYFKENENKAKTLPDKYIKNFARQYPAFNFNNTLSIFERYASGSKNIGDLFKQKDKNQAVRYYQSAIETLEYIKAQPLSYCSDEANISDYCFSSKFTEKFYSNYADVLIALREVIEGNDAVLDEKIRIVKEQRSKTALIKPEEKPKCLSTQ